MLINRYKINYKMIATGVTATTINIPITLESQEIGKSELIENTLVDVELEKAINPILDYEKVRFLPIDSKNQHINEITYIVDLLGNKTYGSIGFTDSDVKFQKERFKQTFLNLNFYDTDNAMTQELISFVTLFASIKTSDLLGTNEQQIKAYNGNIKGIPGQVKSANEIPITFALSSPIFNPRGFAEGYHLYGYKDELKIGESKYLYMRASFKNAKTGKAVNLMVKDAPETIDRLVHEVYTRFILTRTKTGFYYKIDDEYQGNSGKTKNNVTYSNNNIIVNLYQIQAL